MWRPQSSSFRSGLWHASLTSDLEIAPHPRLRFLTLLVEDGNRSADFYRSLGLTERPMRAASLTVLALGDVRLVLATRDDLRDHVPASVLASHNTGGVIISVNVSSMEAVKRGYAAGINSGGASLQPPMQPSWGGLCAWLSDPDGHTVELVWNPQFSAPTSERQTSVTC